MKKDKVLTPNLDIMERSAFHALQISFRECMKIHAGVYSEAFVATDGTFVFPKFYLDKIEKYDKELLEALEYYKKIKDVKPGGKQNEY